MRTLGSNNLGRVDKDSQAGKVSYETRTVMVHTRNVLILQVSRLASCGGQKAGRTTTQCWQKLGYNGMVRPVWGWNLEVESSSQEKEGRIGQPQGIFLAEVRAPAGQAVE